MTDHLDTTGARIDRQTARVQIPVPHGARRVRLSISGTWNDPKGDPTPALVEVCTLGGPPHRPDASGAERARHVRELRLTVDSDTIENLPEGCMGVEVEVKRRSPRMALVVRLQQLEPGHGNKTIATKGADYDARATDG
jgi:hypothetical protein